MQKKHIRLLRGGLFCKRIWPPASPPPSCARCPALAVLRPCHDAPLRLPLPPHFLFKLSESFRWNSSPLRRLLKTEFCQHHVLGEHRSIFVDVCKRRLSGTPILWDFYKCEILCNSVFDFPTGRNTQRPQSQKHHPVLWSNSRTSQLWHRHR